MSSAHLNHIYEWFGTTRAIVKLATIQTHKFRLVTNK